MRHLQRTARSLVLVATICGSLATCNCGELVSCNTSTPAPAGRLSTVLLTDGPFPYQWIKRVDLHIVSVSVSVDADTGASGNFVTIATPERRINVLALANGLTEELGAAPLPKGALTAVRMVIDTDLSSMTTVNGFEITGATNPSIQWQSSAGRPVLNALIHEQISVPDTGAVIVIDYDIGKAFILNRELNPGSLDSGFVFSPVLRAADARRTGSIRGTVRAQTSTGAPVQNVSMLLYLGDPNQPENTWSLMGTAGSDATGAFAFAFVTRSAHWATVAAQAGKTYIVVADPRSGSTLGRAIVSNISVTAGAETNIGAVILP
jgi:hypothetical protein